MSKREGESPATSETDRLETLARSLLHDPIPEDDQPGRRHAYPRSKMILLSLFLAFHASIVLVYNTPTTGLTAPLHAFFNKYGRMSVYIQATGSTQNWRLFAPDAPSVNQFVRVLVEDHQDRLHDLGHDIHGRRQHPYLLYDRMAKINRRVFGEARYRAPYAAWVCREWERSHGGQPARQVRLVEVATRIPPPEVAYASMGYEPRLLPLIQGKTDLFQCAEIPHGQLPGELRARLGLPPAVPGTFKDITVRTWRTDRLTGAPGAGRAGAADAPGLPESIE